MTWLSLAWEFLKDNPILLSLFFGLIVSIGFTQWIKFRWPKRWLEVMKRNVTIGVASSLAFTVTVLMYPIADGDSFRIGLALGITNAVLAPTIYFAFIRIMYKFFPWSRYVLSPDSEERKRGEE